MTNQSFVSKIVDRVVDARLSKHTAKHNLIPVFQSAYRTFHLTETAVAGVMNEMIKAVDQGHVGALMLLDLSTAFDSVDHTNLNVVIQRRFGVSGQALGWLADFLEDRTQAVRACSREAISVTLESGVPQSSLLGPKQFIQYSEDITRVLEKHALIYHLFADNTQGMLHGPPADVPRIASTLTNCFTTDVSHWCATKRLQWNASKTEVLWFGSAVNLSKISPRDMVCAGATDVDSTTVVRNLGVMFDTELSMREHVSRVAQVFFPLASAATSWP